MAGIEEIDAMDSPPLENYLDKGGILIISNYPNLALTENYRYNRYKKKGSQASYLMEHSRYTSNLVNPRNWLYPS